jgi:hypothetical protein
MGLQPLHASQRPLIDAIRGKKVPCVLDEGGEKREGEGGSDCCYYSCDYFGDHYYYHCYYCCCCCCLFLFMRMQDEQGGGLVGPGGSGDMVPLPSGTEVKSADTGPKFPV